MPKPKARTLERALEALSRALAARPKDIQDAAALLIMHPSIDLTRVARCLKEFAELAEEPSLADGLDAVLELAGRSKRD